jgi:hypothetical protein
MFGPRGSIAALLLVTGCPWAPLAAPLAAPAPEPTALSAPTETGDRWVLAEGGGDVAPARLVRLWRQEAERGCGGEYLVLSEHASERRTDRGATGRAHEGFVRCISPEADPAATGERALAHDQGVVRSRAVEERGRP